MVDEESESKEQYSFTPSPEWNPPHYLTLKSFAALSVDIDPEQVKIIFYQPYHEAPPIESLHLVDSLGEPEINYDTSEVDWSQTRFLKLWQNVERRCVERYIDLLQAVNIGLITPLPNIADNFSFEALLNYARGSGWTLPPYLLPRVRIPDVRELDYTSSNMKMLIELFGSFMNGVTDNDPKPDYDGEMKRFVHENWQRICPGQVITECRAKKIINILKRDKDLSGGRPLGARDQHHRRRT